ncbi:hypothetical protein M011DRAFT_471769 [Sporormia fimetaria CBS 119925]|uniref:Transcription factor IIA, alpha/beta subunit n=1 Tax=Sporormia fimetaria CBS 119925 TaxID=1340428 RepID=A0A6A6UY15_9PLEO|nr:hypothetical protein M011DRAFT_471769 [Sporormia fimetaria CBS 119925]
MGLDQSTLDELKQGWQDRLSELKIAAFPWDPQPEPPRQPAPVPSNVKTEADVAHAVSQQDHLNFPNVHNVHIKREGSGYDAPQATYQGHSMPPMPLNGYGSTFSADVAHQRAQALVAQRLGQAPHTMHLPPQPQHGQGQMPPQQRPMPGQGQRPPQPHPHSQPHPAHQRPPQNHTYPPQTDGSNEALDDWNAFMRARAAAGDQDRVAADASIREHIDAMMANVDVGIGMPLAQMPKGSKRKAINRIRQEEQVGNASCSSSGPRVARMDGEEADEDAINSDLDDPDDDLVDNGNDDEDMEDYILCTYDKVQRVKNKWKCVLKDGFLHTNKKEFVFHKATGEFEW